MAANADGESAEIVNLGYRRQPSRKPASEEPILP
jgi:hypothetical protein